MPAPPFRILLLYLCLATAGLAWPAVPTRAAAPDPPHDDWMSAADAWAMPVSPPEGAVSQQNPPDFAWPFQEGATGYQFELTCPDGAVRTREVGGNWLLWPEPLVPGQYAWRVRPVKASSAPGPWSRRRGFQLSPQAKPFLVPPVESLFERTARSGRPRGFPRGEERTRLISALDGPRAEGWRRLRARVRQSLDKPLTAEPADRADEIDRLQARRRAEARIRFRSEKETGYLLEAAFAWLVTGDGRFLREARRRLFNLAAWDPHGPTGYRSADLAAETITRRLAVAFDWLYNELDPSERVRVLAALRPRQEELFQAAIGKDRLLERRPYDSHGWRILATVACTAALLAGEEARAETWCREALPLYLKSICPWGGEDGGFGNGTSYAVWDVAETVFAWEALRQATGVDVYQKAWLRNFGRFLIYFLPPGTPAGCFGDAAEIDLQKAWSLCARAYAARVPTPLHLWYAEQWPEEEPFWLELLFSPVPDQAGLTGPPPGPPPQAAHFPSIGWAALHSDLADPERVSVYFKSSPYGSFNHSHADQNGFVITARGRPLAIDSGYYDWYGSPHWTGWYKQTVAHNAVTFDGGQGQASDDRRAKGRITRFLHQESHDVVVGDAAEAYLGHLTRAVRTVVFIRPGTVIVYDDLASDLPRQWEWNIHARQRISERGPGQIEIDNQGTRLGVRMVNPAGVEFGQTDEFTAAPDPERGSYPKQWHGAFRTAGKTETAEFLAILGVDRESPLDSPPPIRRVGEDWEIRLRDLVVLIGREGCTVQPAR